MQTIEIEFDGGCRPTNPGNKYGSYKVLLDRSEIKSVSEVELGQGTNNEAEFETLLQALEWTLGSLKDYGYSPMEYHLRMWTDSTLVRNRIIGRNQTRKSEPQRRMFDLAAKCLALINQFRSMDILWRSREHNVATFGH